MTYDLFSTESATEPRTERLAPGTMLFHGFVLKSAAELMAEIRRIERQSPFRHMTTRRGYSMSVAMTSCGKLGWISDRSGYSYRTIDPLTGHPWPSMPALFRRIAVEAAELAGYPGFTPESCLINRYAPGSRLTLHQDKDEQALEAPIVSISLGLTADFRFGGLHRSDPSMRIPLVHGDVLVWGGPDRLRFHQVMPIRDGDHPLTGPYRFNMTFRRINRDA